MFDIGALELIVVGVVALLTGSAGFPAGSPPTRLDAGAAAYALVQERMHGRPYSGASWAIP